MLLQPESQEVRVTANHSTYCLRRAWKVYGVEYNGRKLGKYPNSPVLVH